MDEPPGIFLFLFPIISLSVVIVLLVVAALLAMAETACFSLSPGIIQQWSKSGDMRERNVAELMDDPLTVRIALMLVNVPLKVLVISLCVFVLTSFTTDNSFHFAIAPEFILFMTLLLTAASDVFPRTYARKYTSKCARGLSRLLKITVMIVKPAASVMVALRSRWRAAFKVRKPSREELTQALEMAAATDVSVENEKEILRGIVNFGSLKVTDLMKPRTSISAINVDAPFNELISHINRCGFSRIPVYKKSIDSIVGVIYVKDLLPFLDNAPGFIWATILRPGFFVTESKKIDLLLKDFQEKRVHMAIVKDDAGKTSGLITLEDLIEEIIGEINDENDVVETDGYEKLDDNTYVFDGKTPLREFFRVLDLESPDFNVPRNRASLEDFIIDLHDELPSQGDELNYEQLTFVIESIEQKRIRRVRVNVNAQA